MAKLVLTDQTNTYNATSINEQFTRIEAEFQDKVLYRDNPVGESNVMENPIDMNSNRILNLLEPLTANEPARLVDVQNAISGVSTANLVAFTPAGTISSTNVQAAIQEVDSEKMATSSLAAPSGSSLVGHSATINYVAGTIGAIFNDVCLNVKMFPWLAKLDGVTDDTASIQAALATGHNIHIPYSSSGAVTTSSLNCTKSQEITGGGTGLINRSQSMILPQGNFAAFVVDNVFISLRIKNIYVQYGDVVPTVQATHGAMVGFLITGATAWPEHMQLENCTVRGGWWAYYDSTGTYQSKLTQVVSRDCRHGFYKALGTTILFDTCFASGGVFGFYLSNVLAPTMLNCAADSLSITTDSLESCGNYFLSCHALTIIGWDAEANAIDTTGGTDAAYMRFVDTIANVSGVTGLGNTLATSGGGAAGGVNLMRAETNSVINVSGCKDLISGAMTYSGATGYPATLQTDVTSTINVLGSKFSAATGGTPAISTVSTGNVAFSNCVTAGIIASGYSETKNANGLGTSCFSTAKGTTAVTATVPVTLFTLPDSQGIYLVNVFAASSGTNFASCAIFIWDGTTLMQQDIKTGAFTVLTVSGRNVIDTCAGTTTATWSYTKLG